MPVLPPRPLPGSPAVNVYDSTAPEFLLHRLGIRGGEPAEVLDGGPRIALCVEGVAVPRDGAAGELKLSRGESCFLSAADGAVTAAGDATLFVASVGRES